MIHLGRSIFRKTLPQDLSGIEKVLTRHHLGQPKYLRYLWMGPPLQIMKEYDLALMRAEQVKGVHKTFPELTLLGKSVHERLLGQRVILWDIPKPSLIQPVPGPVPNNLKKPAGKSSGFPTSVETLEGNKHGVLRHVLCIGWSSYHRKCYRICRPKIGSNKCLEGFRIAVLCAKYQRCCCIIRKHESYAFLPHDRRERQSVIEEHHPLR
jgi:hypothetical protein